ncbi:hypothetical protein [Paenibacillus silviterrae]|uniref:hypothetical protein n=1 Tax=Paenibacillus silviterrae TaxID=3242194 RepID=UPI0025428E84|nr:hypothetical protein [Paenibacillus chinjuensis]
MLLHNNSRRLTKWTAVLLTVCLALALLAPGISHAGKEGVFIDSSVYFTLEEAALSQGSDNQTLRFQVKLNNDGWTPVDYNRFGVKVTTSAGGSYYAGLLQKGEGIVAAYSAASYYFTSTLPAGVTPDQMFVTIFERNGSGIQDLGSLTVAKLENFRQSHQEVLLALSELDSAASNSEILSFRAMKGFANPQEDGKWLITLDLIVTPQGTDTVTLPAALKYYLRDANGYAHPMTAKLLNGGAALSAGQTSHVLLTASMDRKPSLEGLSLELNKDVSSTKPLGKMSLSALFTLAKTGEEVAYELSGQQGVTVAVAKAEALQQGGKRQALITAVLHNNSGKTLKAPSLAGSLVSASSELTWKTDAVLKPESYVATGADATYKFAAEIPEGVDETTLQFLIGEEVSASSAAANTSSNTGTTNTSANSNANQASSGSSTASTVPVATVSLEGGLISVDSGLEQLTSYELGKPLVFDTTSKLIDSKLEVSVVELSGHTNAENGYQTVVAKFKFLNKSGQTMTLPTFATELTDAFGTSYPGTRQTTELQQLIPNSAYVYSYSYLLPPASEGPYKLSILDQSTTSKYKVSISDYAVQVNKLGEELPYDISPTLAMYPYKIRVESYDISALYSGGNFSYKLGLSLDIQKEEQVITDSAFSTLEFEIIDRNGRTLGSSVQTLQGTNKLISGLQTISFTNLKTEQYNFPLRVRVYEAIATPTGTVKRLLAELKQ